MKDKILIASFVIAAIGYSLCRDTDFSAWIKVIPVLCCLLIFISNGIRIITTDKLIVSGLVLSIIGDISLDVGASTIGTAIFTIVMMIYGIGLYLYNKSAPWIPLILTISFFGAIYCYMYPHLQEQKITGLFYQITLSWMVWRGAVTLYNQHNILPLTSFRSWLILIGTIGIAANGVLYGINEYLYPVPRNLVIHCYYLGQLSLVWGIRKEAVN